MDRFLLFRELTSKDSLFMESPANPASNHHFSSLKVTCRRSLHLEMLEEMALISLDHHKYAMDVKAPSVWSENVRNDEKKGKM